MRLTPAEGAAMVTKRVFDARLRELGATLTEERERWGRSLCLEAPRGQVWASFGTHELTDEYDGRERRKADALGDLFEAMAMGLEPCEDPDCASGCRE